jgi:CYTH domain-containing protein
LVRQWLRDATVMLDQLCERPLIEKTRHREIFAGWTWEIDVFHGDNDGLVVAEVEIANPEDKVKLPRWQEPRFRMTHATSTATLLRTRIGIGGTITLELFRPSLISSSRNITTRSDRV